jgi:hypothetical protein
LFVVSFHSSTQHNINKCWVTVKCQMLRKYKENKSVYMLIDDRIQYLFTSELKTLL